MKEFWDDRYASQEFIYGKHPNGFFQKCLVNLKIGKIFLPAEGEGRNAAYAANLGWNVYAVDFSQEAKNKALTFARDHGVDIIYEVNDLTCHHYRESYYDAAAIIYLHLKGKEKQRILSKIFNSVKRGGAIIVEVFSKSQLQNDSGGPKDIEMLYSINEFGELLKDFHIKILEEKTTFISEGKYHHGNSDVIRVFAFRK